MRVLKKGKEVIIDLETVIVKNKEIDDTDIDGERVMMNMNKGQYFMMNTVGSDIWNSIDEPKDVDFIINQLLVKYEVDYETCKSEVISFIEKLKDAELINIK